LKKYKQMNFEEQTSNNNKCYLEQFVKKKVLKFEQKRSNKKNGTLKK